MNQDQVMDLLEAKVAQIKMKEFEESGQLSLGIFIEKLKQVPQDAQIRFDFNGIPSNLISYRGYYDQLAIENDGEAGVTVGTLLAQCKEAIGKEFTGYKGGEFKMSQHTPIWADNYSMASERAIMDLNIIDGEVVIATKKIES